MSTNHQVIVLADSNSYLLCSEIYCISQVLSECQVLCWALYILIQQPHAIVPILQLRIIGSWKSMYLLLRHTATKLWR